ncbi:ABC transporter ATP-binding protein [Ferrovibrio terrae]|uniref:ABC transporter ATP-binding protein n=1 Tax=Ferrovibrio terrae TaxID=2594003 RepID=A0A516H1F5_9PROT|nr:ABC transporter ATP-binding protein [Ferrovibrio terrae]QDO97621.1 ABC transporter ATP-binding protein [Ferrovibrio terrae]
MKPLLDMHGIVKAYGPVRANDGISLTVPPGSILGLLGENGSGKSTLMKVLFGMVAPDAGSILFKGKELSGHTPGEAIAAGIGMIHQHFMLIEAMTVTENIMLGWQAAGRWLRRDAIRDLLRETSARYGLDLDPDALVADLPLGRRQRVEILKALLRGADLLVLDEPTSNLSPPEVTALLQIMQRLRDEGKSIIFISHKLGEVMEVCDDIVVLRDGKVAGRTAAAETDRAALARMMVGRDIAAPLHRKPSPGGAALLSLNGIATAADQGVALKDISIDVEAGEILAIAGVDGNGQLELAEAVAGLRDLVAGRVLLDGADLSRAGIAARVAAGVAYMPADRAQTSLVQGMSIAENLMLRDASRAPYSRGPWLNRAGLATAAQRLVAAFDIRTPSADLQARQLSGGNQQKIVVAREIDRGPRLLIAHQPTWGLDPGATRFVMDSILALRDSGAAVIYISSELDEVLSIGDRIGVLFDGRLVGVVPRDAVDVGRIGLMMAGSALPTGQAA